MVELKTINMSDISAEPIRWLWKPYIPLGKLSLIQGDGGEGKTTIAMSIVSAVTRGSALPGGGIAPAGKVIVQNAEDSYAQTIKPRLEQLGADCRMIEVIDENEGELSFTDERIEAAIVKFGAKLVVLDPVQAYCKNMNSTEFVRPAMKRLGQVAEDNDCTILLVGHLHKAGGKASYRGLGSIDIYNAVRSVMTVGHIDGDEFIRAMVHNKSNLAPAGASQAFDFHPDNGLTWQGECDITIGELLKGKKKPPGQLDIAKGIIKSMLESGPVSANAMFDYGMEAGVSKVTMKRAKSELGVISEKVNDEWFWKMEGGQGVHKNMMNPLTLLPTGTEG